MTSLITRPSCSKYNRHLDKSFCLKTQKGFTVQLLSRIPERTMKPYGFEKKRKKEVVLLPNDLVRSHHFVVFVVYYVAVPDVSWSFSGVEDELVDSWFRSVGSV